MHGTRSERLAGGAALVACLVGVIAVDAMSSGASDRVRDPGTTQAAIGKPLAEPSSPAADSKAPPERSGPRVNEHNAFGLCRAWEGKTARGKDLTRWPPAAALAEAAGGRARVAEFCREAIAEHHSNR